MVATIMELLGNLTFEFAWGLRGRGYGLTGQNAAGDDCVLACEIEPVTHSQSQAKATVTGLNGVGVKDCR